MSTRSIGVAGEGVPAMCLNNSPSPELKLHSQLQFDLSPGDPGERFWGSWCLSLPCRLSVGR